MKRVLIAEDNPDTRALIALSLRRRAVDFEIEFARTGLEALARYRSAREELRPFDLLVLDVALPLYTGREALRTIREEGDQDTTAIFLTGLTVQEIEKDARCLRAGIWEKPDALADLQTRIEAAL